MSDVYDDFSDLLGAYALDAIEPEERERIEVHLMECPRCRAEVADHREVAALLSQTGSDAPEGVWDRIASELSPPAPPLRLQVTPASSGPVATTSAANEADNVVVPMGSSPRHRYRTRTMVAVVAAAACLVAALGFVSVGQSQRLNRLETALNDRSIEDLADDTAASSQVEATLSGDFGEAEAVVGASGHGYLILEDVPAPPDGELYQLWGQVDESLISLGTFGGDATVVPFSVDADRLDDVSLFAVTQEVAPGVASSQNSPIMAGTV